MNLDLNVTVILDIFPVTTVPWRCPAIESSLITTDPQIILPYYVYMYTLM